MRRISIFFIAFLLLIIPMNVEAAVGECEKDRERIGTILQKGTVQIRHLLDEIKSTMYITDDRKNDFRQSAEWVLAWSQDQYAQIDRKECDSFDSLATSIRAQWEPLHIKVQKIHATVAIWHINQFLFGSMELEEDVRSLFTEAEKLFADVDSTEKIQDSTSLMRRAVFLARQGLRSLKRSSQ